jgi:hypothetical protein
MNVVNVVNVVPNIVGRLERRATWMPPGKLRISWSVLAGYVLMFDNYDAVATGTGLTDSSNDFRF